MARPISAIKKEFAEKGYPTKLSAALIGSCTNSSYEDIGRAAYVANQAKVVGISKMPVSFLVSPGSNQVQFTIERDGQMDVLKGVGATVLANACGPCIGQWKRDDIKDGDKNSIITSFNRNFKGRNDANNETLAFIGSPEIVMAMGLAGRLDFNPITDELEGPKGKIKLKAPEAPELPEKGFVPDPHGYQEPKGSSAQVVVKPNSDRLQILNPFKTWDGKNFTDQFVVAKVKGKCTTDHISPGGPWLKYRGHLENISNNMLLRAESSFAGRVGKGIDQLNGQVDVEFAKIARNYQSKNRGWVIIGDENYGEGSSREHAAMSPRYLGCSAVIVRSFARIHETNLKKQGVLALQFVNSADYDRVQEKDLIDLDVVNLNPGKPVKMTLKHSDGSKEEVLLKHTYSTDQLHWFKSGSALNHIRKNSR